MEESQFLPLKMPDGVYHVSKDFLYFKQLRACTGKEYTDASELIEDYRKYLRLMQHFDTFEQEENQDINSKHPSYPLFARTKNTFKKETEVEWNGKTIPYRITDTSKDDEGNTHFCLVNHKELYQASELEFYIKTSHGLIKLN